MDGGPDAAPVAAADAGPEALPFCDDADAGSDEPQGSCVVLGDFRVQYKPGDTDPADNAIKPHFDVWNDGDTAVPLDELTLRYWYTREGSESQVFWCDYAVIDCSHVHGAFTAAQGQGANFYLEVSFTSGTLAAGAHTGRSSRFNKENWSLYDETDDHWYNAAMPALPTPPRSRCIAAARSPGGQSRRCDRPRARLTRSHAGQAQHCHGAPRRPGGLPCTARRSNGSITATPRRSRAHGTRLLGRSADASDAVHETFVRVLSRVEDHASDEHAVRSLFRISTHVCIDVLRQQRVRNGALPDLLAHAGAAHAEHSAHEARDHVRKLLARCDELATNILVLHGLQGLARNKVAAAPSAPAARRSGTASNTSSNSRKASSAPPDRTSSRNQSTFRIARNASCGISTRADVLHALLALFLLLEELALADDVAAVALGGHVLAHARGRSRAR